MRSFVLEVSSEPEPGSLVPPSQRSRINKGLPLAAHVEHVQPRHGAELLPPQSVTRHHVGLVVREVEQALVRFIQRGGVTFILRLLPLKHAVVWRQKTHTGGASLLKKSNEPALKHSPA